MQIGETFAGIFPNAVAVFDFWEVMSMRYDSLFISFAINLIISGVFLVGVDNKT